MPRLYDSRGKLGGIAHRVSQPGNLKAQSIKGYVETPQPFVMHRQGDRVPLSLLRRSRFLRLLGKVLAPGAIRYCSAPLRQFLCRKRLGHRMGQRNANLLRCKPQFCPLDLSNLQKQFRLLEKPDLPGGQWVVLIANPLWT